MIYHVLAVIEYATGRLYPGWDEYRFRSVAVLVSALLDGLFLQRTVDEGPDVRAVVRGLVRPTGRPSRQTGEEEPRTVS